MTDKSVQFHASLSDMDELIAILRSAVPEVRVYAWTRGGTLREVLSFNIGADVDRLVASDTPLEPHQGSFSALLDAWPGLLVIDVPVLRDKCLREVGVAARSLDDRGMARMNAWGRFIRRLRKKFKSGAFLSDAVSGGGRYYKDAHAMAGALDLQKTGVALLAFAGHVRYDYFAEAP